MKPSIRGTATRGMAKVSVLWSIVFLVGFLVAGAAFFLANGEMEKQLGRANDFERRFRERDAALNERNEAYVALSQVVGFNDPQKGDNTDLETLNKGMASLKEAFPELGDSVKSFQDAAPVLAQVVNDQRQRVRDLQAENTTKQAQIEELQRGMREAGTQAAADAAELRRQLADEQQRVLDIQSDSERRIAELQDQLKNRGAEVVSAQNALADARRQAAQEADATRTRMSEMSRKLQPFVKEPEAADGKVLSVSQVLDAGWIDVGSKNRLPVGTRFKVASPDDRRVKGVCEVRKVERDMAEIVFVEQNDPFDPPTPGDVIWNPVYDPTGERHALLVGGFSGQFAESQLKGLLGGMGVKLQAKFDASTDFLILGNEQYVDEDGQPVETPIQPTDLPVYKEAVAQGVQVVLLKDLRSYFRF
jgi:hypothetical protein